jgi:hypothetical protein
VPRDKIIIFRWKININRRFIPVVCLVSSKLGLDPFPGDMLDKVVDGIAVLMSPASAYPFKPAPAATARQEVCKGSS